MIRTVLLPVVTLLAVFWTFGAYQIVKGLRRRVAIGHEIFVALLTEPTCWLSALSAAVVVFFLAR